MSRITKSFHEEGFSVVLDEIEETVTFTIRNLDTNERHKVILGFVDDTTTIMTELSRESIPSGEYGEDPGMVDDVLNCYNTSYSPLAVSEGMKAAAKEELNQCMDQQKATLLEIPKNSLGGKMAEYQEKTQTIHAWEADTDPDSVKVEKPRFKIVKNRMVAYPEKHLTGQSVIDEWEVRRNDYTNALVELVRIYDEGVRDTEQAVDATAFYDALSTAKDLMEAVKI